MRKSEGFKSSNMTVQEHSLSEAFLDRLVTVQETAEQLYPLLPEVSEDRLRQAVGEDLCFMLNTYQRGNFAAACSLADCRIALLRARIATLS